MKVAFIFILLLVVLLPVMALTTTGDDTLKGKLQTFVSYGLSLTSLLLCLLTVIISVHTLTSDMKYRQIYTVITKPIRRFEFLLGKLLGVVLLGAVLLVVFSVLIYAIVVYTPRYFNPSQAEIIQAQNEFFTARKALSPPDPDVSKEVAQALKGLVESGDIDQVYGGMSNEEIIRELTVLQTAAKRSADAGQELLWEFENVRLQDPNGSLFIRFKYEQVSVTPADSQIYSRWLIGDYRAYKYGIPGDVRLYPVQRKDPIKTFREIEVPGSVVADDGYVAVLFLNDQSNGASVMFPLGEGIQLLYKADTFTANFIRANLVILCRLIFLASLGILASTFLSFPVAILGCVAVFAIATVNEFVVESFYYIDSLDMTIVYAYTLKWLIRLLPQFDKVNPSRYLVPGELLSWSALGFVVLSLICIKAFLLMILGLIIFSFRELARIIV